MLKKIPRTHKSSSSPVKFLTRLKLLIIGSCLLMMGYSPIVVAEEQGEGGGKTEAPKAESEEGGKEEGAKEGGGFIKKDEYLELNAAIEQINAKIRSKNENLKKLLVDKDHAKDPQEFKSLVKEIETEYREINELNENVEKKKAMLRFRFPERSFVKDAEKSKVQHLEEISAEALIEKEMNGLLNVVESQYKTPIRPKAYREKARRDPANEHGNSHEQELQQNPEDFSRSLLLKK